jgi:Zn-dependent protease with chaperone function
MRARLYDGKTSGSREAQLVIEGRGASARLRIRAVGVDLSIPLATIGIGERVGATNRLLQLPDGGSLEVLDNAPFDAALAGAGVSTREAPLRFLESRWVYALAAVLATVACTVGFVRYGIPALATRAVRYIPESADAYIGADSLRVLDRTAFQPSKLAPERQAQLRRLFAEVAAGAGSEGSHYRLELRAGGALGANAFALPSGIVVLTDPLEQLARNDDELRGVFAHEVGHLVNRHAMRMVVEASGSALLMLGVFGDVSGVSSLAAAAPTVLVHAAYSRDLEREADAFAFRWMRQHDVDPGQLGDLLERLQKQSAGQQDGYLASHPELRERVHALRQPATSDVVSSRER